MICIEITVKFLATNPPGIKILIPFYVKVAKAIILEEPFHKNEFGDFTKILGLMNYENVVNEIRIQAMDALKLCYEFTIIFAKLPDIKIQQKNLGNYKRFIFEISMEILNRIAYENEIFKNFENSLKKNIFSLFFVILKNFEEENFNVKKFFKKKKNIL